MNASDGKLTPEEFAEMEAAELEMMTVYPAPEDETIVRAFLRARNPFWPQLPYDWMEIGDEALYEWNLLDRPERVNEAYRHSRADPHQRARYAQDYGRKDVADKWLDALERGSAADQA
jgi:hypothetical protein